MLSSSPSRSDAKFMHVGSTAAVCARISGSVRPSGDAPLSQHEPRTAGDGSSGDATARREMSRSDAAHVLLTLNAQFDFDRPETALAAGELQLVHPSRGAYNKAAPTARALADAAPVLLPLPPPVAALYASVTNSGSYCAVSRKTTRDRQRIVRAATTRAVLADTVTLEAQFGASFHSPPRLQVLPQYQSDGPETPIYSPVPHDRASNTCQDTTLLVTLALDTAPDERPFPCLKCSCQFTRSCHLVDHTRAVHGGEKPFACQVCDYRCTRSSQLTRHTRQRHSEERPHVCNECAYRCLTSGDLTRHKAFVHSDVRRYSCDLCEYRCHTNSRLQQHKLVHAGPRLYSCDWHNCSFECKRASSMAKHKQREHAL